MAGFILSCESKDSLLTLIGDNQHLFIDNDVFSLRNLVETKQDKFMPYLGNLCKKYSEHIHSCVVRITHIPIVPFLLTKYRLVPVKEARARCAHPKL